MTFDIYSLDNLYDDLDVDIDEEEALYEYQDALTSLFLESPEGQELRQTYPEAGFWAAQLIYFGFQYIGDSIPQMTVVGVEEIVTELLPGKVSLLSPDEAYQALPELIAFWEYLKREYKLKRAPAILKYLKGLKPSRFVNWMSNPAKFGLAKSFFMAGQAAGFDMTDEKDVDTFMEIFNASVIAESGGDFGEFPEAPTRRSREDAKEKRKRKAAKASRKRNGKKKRK
jgi:hypothetical protein